MDPYAQAESSAAALARLTGRENHDVAVVLGSGWLPAADALAAHVSPNESPSDLKLDSLGGFPPPTVAGHAGRVRSAVVGEHRVVVFLGRVHLYEGHSPDVVVHSVRTAAAAGCHTLVLTNAAGGVNDDYRAGQAVLVRDHLNLTGASPLSGAPPPPGKGSRFVDLTDLYSSRLRALALAEDPELAEGVYAALRGPHYETPAEVAMLRGLGADLVGMSTALEAIAARHLGVEVLAVSLVTNVAAGLHEGPVSHEEVVATGTAAAGRVGALLAAVLQRL
ncbi:MAG: purine-nucleoside phosphorylase [Acidimicrobiales bacterium]